VTSACIQAFLDACDAAARPSYPASLYLSAVPRRAFTGPFARSRKGHMIFRGGPLYHGNLALIDPRVFETPAVVAVMERLYRRRKRPVASALSGGWRIALGYILGAYLLRVLTPEQMARIASERLGIGIVPVCVDRPEIAIDVDEPDDYDLVTRELAARRAGRP
jgi:hypothetical protein